MGALALLTGLLVTVIGLMPERPQLTSGLLLSQPRPIAAFQLTADNGEPFTNAGLQGHWSLLFAGFTHCPDVCPTTLSLLKQVHATLAERGVEAQVLFLSVDPERDTPEQIGRYVDYFEPSFIGVTGPNERLDVLTNSLALVYQKVPGETPETYTMDHSSALVLINPQGQAVAYFTPPHKADALSADLLRLLR